jgi:uncharacterized protein
MARGGWTQALLKAPKQTLGAALSDMRARFDTWTNALSGLGTLRDKTTYTLPVLSPTLTPATLEAIYHDDDIAARIISALPDEAFREGFTVVSKSAARLGETFLQQNPSASKADAFDVVRGAMKRAPVSVQEQADELQAALDELGLKEKYREAMTWGRLYGLGAGLIGVDDGRETWEEVDWNAIRGIDYLTVLDKRDLTPWRWYTDPQAPKFSDVAIYLMQPVGVYLGAPYDYTSPGAQVLLVHESRMIRFGGELTSKRLRLSNQGADYSVLQKAFRALQLTNDNWQSVAALLADASQGVFKIKGLIEMIAQQPDVMTSRFQFMDMARSVVRAILLDSDGEEFERVSSSLEGVAELLEQTWTRLAAAARMPKQILMGEPPKGLNAGGTADVNIRWWYDTVKSTQEHAVKPQIERILRMLATARGWDDPEDWSVVFPPLYQLTQVEQAQLHLSQAQADKLYVVDIGAATAEEIALSRWGSGKYSLETKIDVQSRKRTMALTLESMEQEAANAVDKALDPAPTPGVAAEAAHKASTETTEPVPPRVVET